MELAGSARVFWLARLIVRALSRVRPTRHRQLRQALVDAALATAHRRQRS